MSVDLLLDSPTHGTMTSFLPKRMDRLPFRKFHLLVACALGISWLLDGLAVSHLNAIAPILEEEWDISDSDTGNTVSIYLVGCVLGSLISGSIIDVIGKESSTRPSQLSSVSQCSLNLSVPTLSFSTSSPSSLV
ncbi:hypothetical protein GEMRC1_008080 [Eukaryota sp. GEM-RC1]